MGCRSRRVENVAEEDGGLCPRQTTGWFRSRLEGSVAGDSVIEGERLTRERRT